MCLRLEFSAMEGPGQCVYDKNIALWEPQTGVFTLRM